MRNDKHIAVKLRKEGTSYSQISVKLGVPKSTLSDWLSDLKWSELIKTKLSRKANYVARKRLRLINKLRREKWAKWREEARKEARKDFLYLKKDLLFASGLMLYWAEGDNKPKNPFRLTNTDPRMIALYTKFLTKTLKVPRENIRAAMILYPDLSEKKCLDFWSEIIKIPKVQFYKTQYIQGRHPTARLANGICIITCRGQQLKEKITVWIDLLSKELIK